MPEELEVLHAALAIVDKHQDHWHRGDGSINMFGNTQTYLGMFIKYFERRAQATEA